ncbi:moesin/ezrin/radixin homolog 2 [Culicoides brevitarsis]|uniref:moesin/ezrin/radixin homolog 2 n=1 Tax=Culicoides brevitarsis TaxID=469753 RepID=UPI00307B89B1
MFKRRKLKSFGVKVISFDSELEFFLDGRATGSYLFDLVCRTIGLRETWYFGLQFEDCKGNLNWLKMDKKVVDQVVDLTKPISFMFFAKFYPENVSEELIQEITQHLFYLQIKQAILSMDIYCPPEASVLLASYSVQAKYGDYDETTCLPSMLASEDLLPQRVIDQYQMTPQMWSERIKTWYADHKGMSRDESEMEYLKIAQDLDMYGVNYFLITNKKNTELWLGVTALGLNIYNKENKLLPCTTFQWSEIRHISFDDKKFIIKPVDSKAPNVIFYSQKLKVNKLILDLCVGNHDLFMKRRKPDTMEIQQMKQQAKEEKQRRQIERNKLLKEKQLREAAEKERALIEEKMTKLQEDMIAAKEALRRSEETAELLAEKNRLAEEEAILLSHKANEVEQEISIIRMTARKTEEEKNHLEKRTKEAEVLTNHLFEESKRKAAEAECLKNELILARVSEKEAKERLLTFLSQSSNAISLRDSHLDIGHNESEILNSNDINQLSLEIEKERIEYLSKARHVQSQLQDLRSEMELLKIMENQCTFDDIAAEQVKLGENKYSTLKKSGSGSTKARVAFFEDL